MRKVLLSCLLVMVGVCTLAAQNSEWYFNKPIKDIRFTGIERVAITELEGVIKPFIGKPLTEAILLDIQRRLYALEFFDYILPDAIPADDTKSAVIINFTVQERPTVSDIQFRGNSGLRTTELLNELTIKTGSVVSKAKINLDEESLRKFYLKSGFAAAEITSSLEESKPSNDPKKKNSKILVFNIKEGYKNSIRKIQFSGNQFASESTLRGLLKSKEQALFEPGTFMDENLELDKQAIIKYYHDNGFVDAKIVDIKKTVEDVAKDKRSYLTLVYYLSEGEQWNLGTISVSGNELFSTEQLTALIRSKPGTLVNLNRVQSDYQAIADQYYQNGYINNSIDIQEKRNPETKTVDYEIKIVERGRAYVENIIIRGNNKTKLNTILRELPFETGDVFSAKRIREAMLNLTNKRFFTNTGIVPETPAGSAPGLYDLILNLTEANTIDFRIGFAITGSTDFPLSGFLRLSDSNFLGNGQEVAAELNLSPTEQKVTASFTDPWLFGPNWSGGINLSFDRAKISGVPQDILGPTFTGMDSDGPLGVPDPYTGQYVYPDGHYFVGVPTQAQIDDNGLKTDYEYAGSISGIPSEYLMSYINWDINLGVNTGQLIRTPAGRFIWTVFGSTGLNLVEYDASKYRPWSQSLRENYNQFLFQNRLGFSLKLDKRDITYDPSSGYMVSETLTLAGGFLSGSRHYISTETKLEGYVTLWDVPISDTANFKTVLASGTSLTFLLPQFNGSFIAEESLLYTNMMTIARGWPQKTNGQALFNSWLELRTPIIPGTLSFDLYGEAVSLSTDRDKLFDGSPSSLKDHWMFGFGAGIRVLNPSLPIRLYIAKRFGLDGVGGITWQGGNLGKGTDPTSGVDIIFAFSLVN